MGQEGIVLNIIDYLDANLTEEITIDSIVGKFYFNRFYLMKLFKKVTGLTIFEYVNQKKIKSSLNDIVNTDDKILKIALNHGFNSQEYYGFNSQEYYSETFTRVLGISPTEFRKQAPIDPNNLNMKDDKMTRLEQIQSEIAFLNDLRTQLIFSKEQTFSEQKTDESKVKILRADKPKVYQLKTPFDSRKAA